MFVGPALGDRFDWRDKIIIGRGEPFTGQVSDSTAPRDLKKGRPDGTPLQETEITAPLCCRIDSDLRQMAYQGFDSFGGIFVIFQLAG
jgi:hypothetical protein